jgi:pimeloyl-ACP methyl ester carboxylesterase
MNVVVNGLMSNYQKVGNGKAIVFLHGWADSAKSFSDLIAGLQDKFEIYALDLPGFGGTQMPPRAWGLDDYADFLNAWLNKLQVEPFGMVGHSYGGAVAITAVSQGLPVNKLILLASAGIRGKRPLRKKLMTAGAKAAKVPLLVLPADKRRRIKKKLYGSIGSDLMLVPHMEQTFRRIISEDVRTKAAKIDVPTLLIYGSKDKQTPPSDGHILNRSIKGSRLEIIGGGHFLHQEQAAKIAGLIKNFLEDEA